MFLGGMTAKSLSRLEAASADLARKVLRHSFLMLENFLALWFRPENLVLLRDNTGKGGQILAGGGRQLHGKRLLIAE